MTLLNFTIGPQQRSHLTKYPFHKHLVGSLALIVLGFNVTKRYYTFPEHVKDDSQPMLLLNGELHPFENQPKVNIRSLITFSGCRGEIQDVHSSQSWFVTNFKHRLSVQTLI